MSVMDVDAQKRRAGEAAAELVENGMRLGLGTGSTARYFTEAVARRLLRGQLDGVVGVPTSRATAELALELGIPLVDLDAPLDLAVDGADEIGPRLGLIKGGGGALLREKIVAAAAERFVVIADSSKLVEHLGETFALPVEIARFGHLVTLSALQRAGEAWLRGGERPFVTDNGNYIVDVATGPISDAEGLSAALALTPGVVETGLFVGLADLAIIGTDTGVEELAPA